MMEKKILFRIIDDARDVVLKTIPKQMFVERYGVEAMCKLFKEYHTMDGITIEWLRDRFEQEKSTVTIAKTKDCHDAILSVRHYKLEVLKIIGKKVKEVVDKEKSKSNVIDNKANRKQQ